MRDAEERQRLAKERELPPEKRGELDAWIDAALIATRNERLLRCLSSISDEVFGSFWDNPIDAEYDKL